MTRLMLMQSGVESKLRRIESEARADAAWVFTDLSRRLDLPLMREAHRRTIRKGLRSDRRRARRFAKDLDGNLGGLLEQFLAGEYRPPPGRLIEVSKSHGKVRTLCVARFEDKILQHAVRMLLGPIFEVDFLPCSYAYRPGRSPKKALHDLARGLEAWGGAWVLDFDVASYFDTVDHDRLRCFLDRRVRDEAIRRAIDGWLAAGAVVDGALRPRDRGLPQGYVVSPLLANVFLHEVLDRWFEESVRPRVPGDAFLVRYGDDALAAFTDELAARQQHLMLQKRLGNHGLSMNEEKTTLVRFFPPNGVPKSKRRVTTGWFDYLGMTLYWGSSRRGRWVVRRKMSHRRYWKKLNAYRKWCAEVVDLPWGRQRRELERKLVGTMEYYRSVDRGGLPALRDRVVRIWQRTVTERLPWEDRRRFQRFLKAEKRANPGDGRRLKRGGKRGD